MLLFYLKLAILRPEVRERASHTTFVLNFNENHSESDPTRTNPAEGSSASVQIRTAPQRERSDTHDPRRGFIGRARALRHARSPQRVRRPVCKFARRHSESDPTRTIPQRARRRRRKFARRGATARALRHARSRRGFVGERANAHGATARVLRHARSPQRVRRPRRKFAWRHSESAPTCTIPAEGSSASVQMRTLPQRERSDTHDPCRRFVGHVESSHGATARALQHARSRQRVRRPRRKFARRHSESDPTRTIPAEGSSATWKIRTAPQRERSDTHDPRRGFVPPAPAKRAPG